MVEDLNNGDFWEGEEEEGYFDESRFPRVWLLAMGILSVFLVVGVVALVFLALFRPIPTPTPVLSPAKGPALSPTEESAPPPSVSLPEKGAEAEATPTSVMVPNTPVSPLFTSTPGPVMPAEITIGIYVKVSGTEGSDLSFRAGPSTNYVRLKIVAEGSILKVLDGPTEADGYVWWKLQDASDGMVGWAVADYLNPTVP